MCVLPVNMDVEFDCCLTGVVVVVTIDAHALSGELEEDVYYDQLNLLERVQSMLFKVDAGSSQDGQVRFKLSKEQIGAALKDFFPTKSDDNFHRLIVVCFILLCRNTPLRRI